MNPMTQDCPLSVSQFSRLSPELQQSTDWIWFPPRITDEVLDRVIAVCDRNALKPIALQIFAAPVMEVEHA